MRSRLALALTVVAVAIAGMAALLLAAGLTPFAHLRPSSPLAGRLGGPAATLGAGGTPPVLLGPLRRQLAVPGGTVLFDLSAGQIVRQITIGRQRAVESLWEPAPGDWSLAAAQSLAQRWLPRDAAFVHVEPFFFRGRVAGTREVYVSEALRREFDQAAYSAFGAVGPPGTIAVTYYSTEAGTVALILIGLY